jgi:dUTPase
MPKITKNSEGSDKFMPHTESDSSSNIPNFKFALREDLINHREFLPNKAEPLATGWDVRCAVKDGIKLMPFQKVLIPLGFRSLCPEGWWFELKPRSSTFGKKNLHCLYGTIDESYEGELLLACQFIPEAILKTDSEVSFSSCSKLSISFGDALGQIIPVRRKEMVIEEVSNEEFNKLCAARAATRGAGGFGSTDKSK